MTQPTDLANLFARMDAVNKVFGLWISAGGTSEAKIRGNEPVVYACERAMAVLQKGDPVDEVMGRLTEACKVGDVHLVNGEYRYVKPLVCEHAVRSDAGCVCPEKCFCRVVGTCGPHHLFCEPCGMFWVVSGGPHTCNGVRQDDIRSPRAQ